MAAISRALVSLTALLTACSAPSTTESTASTEDAIVNGVPSGPEHDAVLYVRVPGELACTATVIAPNVVLTALHCLAHLGEGTFSCDREGMLESSVPGAGEIGAVVEPERFEVYVEPNVPPGEPDAVGARIFGTGSTTICRQDIAVVVLDRPLSPPAFPVRLDRGTRRGETMTVIGYGYTEGTSTARRNVRTGVRVTAVGEANDMPADGIASPYTLVGDEGACHGDSGGPALSEDTGAIIGVYSLLTGATCQSAGVRNVYTQTAPFEDLIREALEYAGAEPVVEPPEPSTGEGGAGGVDSGSSGQGGDPSQGDAGAEAGGVPSTGAAPGTGGSTSSGGSSNGGTNEAGGEPASGNQAGTETPPPVGSGSRHDASCGCRIQDVSQGSRGSSFATLALLALTALRRGRRRIRG